MRLAHLEPVCVHESLPCSNSQLAGSRVQMGKDDACESRRGTTRIATYPGDQSLVWTHSDCVRNELLSLKNIHQFDSGARADPDYVDSGFDHMCGWYAGGFDHQLSPLSYLEVVSRYKGRMRRRMQRAYEDLSDVGLQPNDIRVTMFLKDDKYIGDAIDDVDGQPSGCKPARCIQYRHPRYNLCLMRYIAVFEKEMMGYTDWTNTPIVSKGLDCYEVASVLKAKYDAFHRPVGLLFDQSKFDAHYNYSCMRGVHKVYHARMGDRRLRRLLSVQYRNKGYTKHGTKYRTLCTHMSGEADTSCGNSVCNLCMLEHLAYVLKIKHSDLALGDDSVMIIEEADLEKVLEYYEQHFSKYGMVCKLELAFEFEEIEFCQMRPVQVNDRWVMLRNPYRLLTRSLWSVKPVFNSRYRARLVRSIGYCELASNLGAPVGQAFAVGMINAGSGRLIGTLDQFHRVEVQRADFKRMQPMTISDNTRHSYCRAWGVTPEKQSEMECRLQCVIISGTTVDDFIRSVGAW